MMGNILITVLARGEWDLRIVDLITAVRASCVRSLGYLRSCLGYGSVY